MYVIDVNEICMLKCSTVGLEFECGSVALAGEGTSD